MTAGLDTDSLASIVERAQREVDEGLLPSCQVAIAVEGQVVLDATFGADPSSRYVVYSTTKAVTAGALWRLLDTTEVGRGTPVADLVEGFGSCDKGSVTVEHLLTHTAGFPNAEMPVDAWRDPGLRAERFGAWQLEWEPGSRFTYHPRSAHWALAAVIEAATGRDFREYMHSEVLEPLGLTNLTLGTPPAEQGEVLDVIPVGDQPDGDTLAGLAEATGLDASAIGIDEDDLLMQNDPGFRALGHPGGGAIGRAADLAMYYQALMSNPGDLWRPDTLSAGTAEILCTHTDPMTGVPANRTLGLVVAGDDGNAFMRGFGSACSPRAFGHMGAGGQVAWADPATGISFAYLTNGLDRDLLRMGVRGHELSTLAGALLG